jgi:ribonuclease HI
MVFYAVANGRTNGIFLSWDECSQSVKGYKNAIYKKFDTKKEAETFIQLHCQNSLVITKEDVESKTNERTDEFIPDYYVYTDGACSNNGRENALAGIGIFFGIEDTRNVSKRIQGKQTNNTAELTAIIEVYSIIERDAVCGKRIAIVSDSEYAIKCVSSYGEKFHKKEWNVDIPNKELVKKAYEIYMDKPNIRFIHIKAHTNNTDVHSFGNDQADKLANEAIGLEQCPYNKPNNRVHLMVPFTKKDEIKGLGGLWDVEKKKWFIYENNKKRDAVFHLFPKSENI